MKLLTVIPIARGINKENLTYFTASEPTIGSVVKVPLRKKTVSAIVISTEEIADVKAEIKNASFETRKVNKIKSSPLLSLEFMETVAKSALYFASTSGSVLYSVVPKIIIEGSEKIKVKIKNLKTENERVHEKLVLQSDDEERYATYKSLIREEFAKGYSVFFCLPTIQDIKKAHERLSKGIEQYTFVLHSFLGKKEQLEVWNKAANEEHPSLIIATGTFLGIPRNDLGTIIVDKENTRAYKNQNRPFVDIRILAEIFAEKIKAKIIFGDLLLRTETIWRHNESELFEIAPLKFRSLTTSTPKLIDMKESLPAEVSSGGENKSPKFRLFSSDLLDLIQKNQANDENLFIFVARRGLFPSTVCSDCGNLVKCNTCGAPTVLHKATKENFFLCHRCGERRSANEKCQNCQSWRLGAFGIGIEAVEEEIRQKFPQLKIFKIDSDSASTHKKALEIVAKFYTSPSSVLLGTEMALLYLKDMIANTAVASIDSFFSIPDFRINEKVMNILLKIRAITSRNFLVQTRDIEQKISKYATMGNLADFYRDEIKERENLFYPPFSLPIKITLQGDKKTVLAGMEQLQKDMTPYEVDVFPAFIPGLRGKFSMHGLIKIKRSDWVDSVLWKKLRQLSPIYTINIDPESFL
ncbi:MAG: primosomal protein N' [Candidatus Taylorbacteria bacterium RIFOXYD2_FULL_36_9]|uniref:Primosomal protein N n=1 Tax=Candidatus Taylorbacteria bacterium RIFOXYD2_FULL_36_9 TaxID=1802338 RepID=A0A1G2PD29_9BACT|nr:MAG: primosomal protein N' [Candidatus Taylorbacteria bacterium RIFOXYD2_FULL_36_9]